MYAWFRYTIKSPNNKSLLSVCPAKQKLPIFNRTVGMFGTAGKSGRGGRRGAGGKRKLNSKFSSASFNRPSGGRPAGDTSRNKCTTTATPATVAATAPVEETYSLVTGNSLDFAMIIRLTPDIVDEIKRAESQGGSARIKFHAIANNSSGNVSRFVFAIFTCIRLFYFVTKFISKLLI